MNRFIHSTLPHRIDPSPLSLTSHALTPLVFAQGEDATYCYSANRKMPPDIDYTSWVQPASFWYLCFSFPFPCCCCIMSLSHRRGLCVYAVWKDESIPRVSPAPQECLFGATKWSPIGLLLTSLEFHILEADQFLQGVWLVEMLCFWVLFPWRASLDSILKELWPQLTCY